MTLHTQHNESTFGPVIAPAPVAADPSTFHKKDTRVKGDDSARARRLGDMPDLYKSANAALTPATGPSATIQNTLDEVITQSSAVLQKHVLSETGRKVTQDIRLLAEDSQRTMNEKLEGGKLIEDMIDARKGIARGKSQNPLPGIEDKETLTTQGKDAATQIAKVLKLAATSSEFRGIVGEFASFLNEAISSWAGRAQTRIDKGASNLQQHMESANNTGGMSQPPSSSSLDNGLRRHVPMATSTQSITEEVESGDRSTTIWQSTQVVVTAAEEEVANTETSGSQKDQSILGRARSTALSKIRRSMSNMSLNTDQKNRLASRFKAIMLDVQRHPEYESTLDFIVDSFETLLSSFRGQVGDNLEAVNGIAAESNGDWYRLKTDLKKLLQNFAGGRSPDTLLAYCAELVTEMKGDPEMQAFWLELRTFAKRSFREPEFVDNVDYENKVKDFLTRGRSHVYGNDRYRDVMLNIAEEGDYFIQATNNDPSTQHIKQNIRALWNDAFMDDNGRPVIKLDLLQDMQRVLPSILKENLHSLTIPRVEYFDDQFDIFADSIIIHAEGVLPKYIVMDIRTAYDTTLPPGHLSQSFSTYIRLQVSEMQVYANNIEFGYKKKSGWPHVRDHGLVDFATSRHGVKLECLLQPDFTGKGERSFRVVESTCVIDRLDIKLHDTRHALMNKMIQPIVTKMVKKRIQQTVEQKMNEIILKVDNGMKFVGGAMKTTKTKANVKAQERGILQAAT